MAFLFVTLSPRTDITITGGSNLGGYPLETSNEHAQDRSNMFADWYLIVLSSILNGAGTIV